LTIELLVEDLSHDARGIAHRDGKAVFIAGALPGERVRVHKLHQGKSFDQASLASLDDILQASPDRVTPRCAHFGVCSGCSLQHLAPEAQIAIKHRQLQQDLKRIGRVEAERWLEPLRAAPWNYRHKARLSVKDVQKKAKVLVGFRELDGRFVADITRCHTLAATIGDRIPALAQLIESLQARREIPQIEVAIADNASALVFRHLTALSESDLAKLRAFGVREQLQIWLQPKGPDSVQALEPGPEPLQYALPDYDLTVQFQPLDFTQVNPSLNRAMVPHALALLGMQPGQKVLELFCGLGNFTLAMARQALQVTAIEGDAGLVQRANANAVRLGLQAHIRYHCANLFEPQIDSGWLQQNYDAMLLDPPRAGAEHILRELPANAFARIVYVSCNPATLARDAEILVHEKGYRLSAAGVMDMFTHTAHVESIALFERSDASHAAR
jgi:23S rRNA (uracil1939-C5)-methyltransferase